jgi:hypothetical protein
MRASHVVAVTETGDVTTRDTYLRGVSLTGGSDAATLTLKAGGSSGTTVLVVKAATNTTVHVPLYDSFCGGGVHATVAGTAPSATFVLS